jgi:chemotaxis protein CheY-P-specific phosphatase CheC
MQEIGNIILGTAITAFGRMLNLKIMHTIPDAAIDRLGAVSDSVVLEIGQRAGQVLSFRITLTVNQAPLKGDLYFLFDATASTALLTAARRLLPPEAK